MEYIEVARCLETVGDQMAKNRRLSNNVSFSRTMEEGKEMFSKRANQNVQS
jgi:hypothetical protein